MDSKIRNLIKEKNLQINQDLRSRSIDELLYIYFNTEKYVFEMMNNEKKENLKLIENLKNKIKELDKNKASYRNALKELNQYNVKINEKEKEIQDLFKKKDELDQKNTKKNLIEIINKKINENYKKPKDMLYKDFFKKKITLEEYMEKFKLAGFNYYYHNLMSQQIDKI